MSQAQEETRQVTMSINEMIFIQLRDLKESQRELKAEIKDIRLELRETRKELNSRIDKQNEKIDKLSNKIDASSNHGQIATISTIGIGVAAASSTVALLYTLLAK